MSAHPPKRLLSQVLGATLALVTCFAVAAPAVAGIGNPLKKAKEKVEKTVAPDESDEPATIDNATPVFDDVVLELTEARVAAMVQAFQASQAQNAARQAAMEKRNKIGEERGKLWEKEGDKIRELQNKRGDIEICYQDGYHEAQDRLSQEYAQKALTDPGIREKFGKAAMEYNAAAARGDTAATAELYKVLYSETVISSEDSAAVRKQCGPLPPTSPAEAKIAKLDADLAAADEQIRQIDAGFVADQAKAVQMTQQQYGMAMDRVQYYMSWRRSKKQDSPNQNGKASARPPGYTDEEIEALEKHYQELKDALG